jgi:formate dehydrogenase subunit beta
MIETSDDIAERLNWQPSNRDGRDKAIARLTAIRHNRREAAIAKAEQMVNDVSSLFAMFAQCDACGKCNDACPFCGTAAFRPSLSKNSRTFNMPESVNGMWPAHQDGIGPFDDLVAWGRRSASCVSCGMCESACEKHTPLVAIQAVLGRKLRQVYHYVPGRSLDERLPWAMA